MELLTLDGSILQFASMFWYNASDTVVPVYKVSSGIYDDKKDYFDNQEYIYWAYI